MNINLAPSALSVDRKVPMSRPFILGIGGTTRRNSSSEFVLRQVMEELEAAGAETELIVGTQLDFPAFDPSVAGRSAQLAHFVNSLRRADGVVVSTPAYHGCLSGMIKNALDYTEDLRDEGYLEGRPIGCIVCAEGAQALGSTLAAMRSITHTLRAWPTPLALTIDTSHRNPETGFPYFDQAKIRIMADQVLYLGRIHAEERERALAA